MEKVPFAELKRRLSSMQIPTQPIEIDQGVSVIDGVVFMKSHICALENHKLDKHSKWRLLPYYERLLKYYYKILEFQK